MSFFSSNARHEDTKNELLDEVLNTQAKRIELATIIALCSDSLRQDLLAVFTPVERPADANEGGKASSDLLIDLSEPVRAIEGKGQLASNLERLDQSDIETPRCQGLRRAALLHFDKWQTDVLKRIGEVLSVRPDAVRSARATAKRQAEVKAKAARDQAYYAWANGDDSTSDTVNEANSEHVLLEGFEPTIAKFARDQRVLILDSVLLLLLSLEHYSSHSRMLMLSLTQVLELPESTLVANEAKVAEGLLASAAAKTTTDESTQRQASQSVVDRRWKVGLATIAGAALIGVTGGLAAPFLAAGIGSIMGGIGLGAVATLLGPLATNMVLVGGLFGAYGGKMTGEIAEKYTQEIKDFKFVPIVNDAHGENHSAMSAQPDASGLEQLKNPDVVKIHKLRVVVGVSGTAQAEADFSKPFNVFSTTKIEAFGLRWELDALAALTSKISTVLGKMAINFAGYQLLSMLVAGLWPIGLLTAAKSLDSPFAIAKVRGDKAGRVLADALIHHVQGQRPVTLVGYGLGARVIYSCLLQLAEQNAFGLVESVVLMGAPVPSDAASWRRCRSVVSGRLINVYNTNDFRLGLLYRASSMQMGIAGLQKIVGVSGIESYDCTDMIGSHERYEVMVGSILQRIGFRDLDAEMVKLQQAKDNIPAAKTKQQQADTNEKVVFAREDQEGHIIPVNEKGDTAFELSQSDYEKNAQVVGVVDTDDEIPHRISMVDLDDDDGDGTGPLATLHPEPEPVSGSDRETVRFGGGERAFSVNWDSRR